MMTRTMVGRSPPAADATPSRYGASAAAAPACRKARRVGGMRLSLCAAAPRHNRRDNSSAELPARSRALAARERPVMRRAERVESLVENESSPRRIERSSRDFGVGLRLYRLRLGFHGQRLGLPGHRLGIHGHRLGLRVRNHRFRLCNDRLRLGNKWLGFCNNRVALRDDWPLRFHLDLRSRARSPPRAGPEEPAQESAALWLWIRPRERDGFDNDRLQLHR